MQEKVKKGFARFSVGTSIHGFSELYYARSMFWIVVWFIILTGAFAVTTYQIWGAVSEYLAEPVNTVILPADESQILYPPLRMCYMMWPYWVDWRKAVDSFNISKEVLLFSLNYFNAIYSSDMFDLNEAHEKFGRIMEENKFNTLSQFYFHIARDVPIIGDNNLTSYFDKKEIIYKDPGFLFCYTMSEQQLYNYFDKTVKLDDPTWNGKIISFTVFDETYPKIANYVTVHEYNRYSRRWIQLKSMYRVTPEFQNDNFTDFAPPILIFPNAYNKKDVDIFTEDDIYTISMQGAARTTKNRPKLPCLAGAQSTMTNDTCKMKCSAIKYNATCSCLSLDSSLIFNNDSPERLCQKGVTFLSPTGDNTVSFDSKTYSQQKCPNNPSVSKQYNECINACVTPCTAWTYDTSVSVTRMSSVVRKIGKKNSTNITIEYPMGVRIIVMTEVDAQSWETFVGSVGGLLGIWTGASIVSFIQLFYLCCFAEEENIMMHFFRTYFGCFMGKRKDNVQTIKLSA